MNNCLNIIIQKITLIKAIIFTVLFISFYALINFSEIGVAGLLRATNGANILDFEFGYNQEEAYRVLIDLGVEGRLFYQSKILPLDFLLPFIYMLFFVGWFALLIKYAVRTDYYKYLLLIPVFTMLFDWIENAGIIAMLNSYPNIAVWAVMLASIFGMLKTVFTIVNVVIFIVLFIFFMLKNSPTRTGTL